MCQPNVKPNVLTWLKEWCFYLERSLMCLSSAKPDVFTWRKAYPPPGEKYSVFTRNKA